MPRGRVSRTPSAAAFSSPSIRRRQSGAPALLPVGHVAFVGASLCSGTDALRSARHGFPREQRRLLRGDGSRAGRPPRRRSGSPLVHSNGEGLRLGALVPSAPSTQRRWRRRRPGRWVEEGSRSTAIACCHPRSKADAASSHLSNDGGGSTLPALPSRHGARAMTSLSRCSVARARPSAWPALDSTAFQKLRSLFLQDERAAVSTIPPPA